ncbi:MAG: hypothetical protein ACYDHZ_00425 [Dehalococcoidia bacterium]
MAISTLYDILFSSLRVIGVVQEEDYGDVSSYKINSAIDAMNLMLDQLSDVIVFATTSEDLNLVSGKATYTMGLGGDFNTGRPNKIMDTCYVRDTVNGVNVDYPLSIIGEEQYNSIDIKDTQSIPEFIWFDSQYPLANLTFYYVPDKAYQFHCVSEKPLSEILSLTSTISLPPGYKAFLKWNTAEALAADYPAQASQPNFQLIMAKATESRTLIQRINAANRVEETKLDCPQTKRGAIDCRGAFMAGRV